MATSQDFVNWVCSEAVDPRFLMYALMAEGDHILNFGKGTTHTTIYFPEALAFHLCLAPLAEQRRIVEKVEALIEQVNRAKARVDRVAQILNRFRDAMLASACSGRLTEDWRNLNPLAIVKQPVVAGSAEDTDDNPETSATEIPPTWTWIAIDDVCEAVIDYRGRTPPVTEHGTIPHIRTSNVRNGRIDWLTESFVTEDVYRKYMTRGLPRQGDVIFTMEAPLGETALVDSDRKFSLAQRLLLLRGKETLVCGAYLALVLRAAPVRHQIEHRATGSTVSGIAYKRLKGVRLPVPPLAEQMEIVRRVTAAIELVNEVEARVVAGTGRANGLPRAVLAKAFAGELVPTEAELARTEGRSYETAEELLARVRSTNERGGNAGTPGRGTRTGVRRTRTASRMPAR